MRLISQILLSLFLLCNHLMILSLIECATVAVRNDCKVIFLHEIHVDDLRKPKIPAQRKAVFAHLVELNTTAEQNKKPFVIVEDPSNYTGNNSYIKKLFFELIGNERKKKAVDEIILEEEKALVNANIVDSAEMIGYFVSDCKKNNIDCYNAEGRGAKIMAVTHAPILIRDVRREFSQVCQNAQLELDVLARDDDTEIVAEAVQRILLEARQTESKELGLAFPHQSYKDLYDNCTDEERSDLLMMNEKIIDARMLLSWFKNKLRRNIFIICGSDHFDNILPIFKKIGFQIFQYGKEFKFKDPKKEESHDENRKAMARAIENSLDMELFFKKSHRICKCPECGIYQRNKTKLQEHRETKHDIKSQSLHKPLIKPEPQPLPKIQQDSTTFNRIWMYLILGVIGWGAYWWWKR